METVHFTIFTTQWELYSSQRLPHNGNSTLINGKYTMGMIHFKMVSHNGNCTFHSDYHKMGTLHFKMVTHNGNCTRHNGYDTNAITEKKQKN